MCMKARQEWKIHQWGGMEQNQTSHWTPWCPSNNNQTPKADVVWTRDQIIRACKDHITGNSTRRKGERQTEEEMGGQYYRLDRIGAERHLDECGESWGMEGDGCQDPCGGLTVHDYGIGEGEFVWKATIGSRIFYLATCLYRQNILFSN